MEEKKTKYNKKKNKKKIESKRNKKKTIASVSQHRKT